MKISRLSVPHLFAMLTVDWVQDAARERYRRRQILREARKRRGASWSKRILYSLMDAGQPWIVITLIGISHLPPLPASARCFQGVNVVGIFIGVNAACINVITEWLSDFKLGYCSQGWYLNQQFCCWQESLETCTAWKPWSSITLINYIFYVLFAVPNSHLP
jgi:chloride channel 3/4/5